MLYLGIDQHRKQLTVNLRDEAGDVLLKRQVSTEWKRVRAFFEQLKGLAEDADGFAAIVEVCGFNDWLLKMLDEYDCRETVLIQPDKRSKKKTDRRDASALSEILWINRLRLLGKKRMRGLRRVFLPSKEDAESRRITAMRRRLGQQRTRTVNKVQRILLKHNLQQDMPVKGIQTKTARKWLATVALPDGDRFEMDLLLAQWDLWERQIGAITEEIHSQCEDNKAVAVLKTHPGGADYSSLALACRIGDIKRFPTPGSLANYCGLTPGCRNSGDANNRMGSITKEGSSMIRFILGQLVLHVLRCDPWMKQWYLRIKRRRGAKIARVAVMRRLTTIIWHMLTYEEPYVIGGPPRLRNTRKRREQLASLEASAPARQKGPPLSPSPSIGPEGPSAQG